MNSTPRVRKAESKERFPLLIRKDSVSAKVYRTVANKGGQAYVSFWVAHKIDGKRKLKAFADLAEAKAEAWRIVGDIASGVQSALTLSGTDRLAYVRAEEILHAHGVAVDAVAAEWSEARAILKGMATLTEACREYAKRHGSIATKIMVPDAVAGMIEQEKQEHGSTGRKSAWIKLLRAHVQNKFAGAFHTYVASIESKDVATWLAGLKCAERTKKNVRDCVDHFFRWCRGQGYLPKDADPLADVQDYRKRRRGAITTLTPDALAKLLTHADERLVPYLALRAFAGLRDSEASKIDWQAIDLKDHWLTIGEEVGKQTDSKEGVRRLIPIRPNLAAWLRPHAQKAGPVCPFANTTNELAELCGKAGVHWERNCLRHSYISAAVAESGDIPRVALESGNSPAVIRQHYLRAMKPSQAAEWFSIVPQKAENVVALPAAGAA